MKVSNGVPFGLSKSDNKVNIKLTFKQTYPSLRQIDKTITRQGTIQDVDQKNIPFLPRHNIPPVALYHPVGYPVCDLMYLRMFETPFQQH